MLDNEDKFKEAFSYTSKFKINHLRSKIICHVFLSFTQVACLPSPLSLPPCKNQGFCSLVC